MRVRLPPPLPRRGCCPVTFTPAGSSGARLVPIRRGLWSCERPQRSFLRCSAAAHGASIHRAFGRWRCTALMHVAGAMCAPALPKCSLPLCSTRCQPGLVLPLVVRVSPARLGAACADPVGESVRRGSVGSWDHPEVCGLALNISCLGPWGWGHQASPLWSPLVSSPLNPVSGPCLALGAPGELQPLRSS